jgi:hypothetical protein
VLDTDAVDNKGASCPYVAPARLGSDGLQIDAGSMKAPNVLPKESLHFVLDGLQMFVDQAYPFSILVVDVAIPHRSMPVEVRIGLGTAMTAETILRSLTAV